MEVFTDLLGQNKTKQPLFPNKKSAHENGVNLNDLKSNKIATKYEAHAARIV